MKRPSRRTHYDELGIHPGAGQKEIEMAYYRRRSRERAGAGIRPWEEAYLTLSDPVRRRAYDRLMGLEDHPAWKEGKAAAIADRLHDRALALVGKGREREALRCLKSSLRLRPAAAAGMRSLLALLMARAGGDVSAGLRQAMAAYRQAPRDPGVIKNLAAVCELAGLKKRASGLRRSLPKTDQMVLPRR